MGITCDANRNELRPKVPAVGVLTTIGILILQMPRQNAFLRREEVRFNAANMFDRSGSGILGQQIGEDPTHAAQPQETSHFIHLRLVFIFQQKNGITGAFLGRLVNGCDPSSDTQRNVRMDFVGAEEHTDALMPGRAPIVQKPFHYSGVFEHNVVDVPIGLPIERNGRRLTLGADALGPRRMIPAARFDLAVEILQGNKLATVHPGGELLQMRMEREVFDLLLLEVGLVPRFQRGTMDATAIRVVTAPVEGR